MAVFLYYIPGVSNESDGAKRQSLLDAAGLSDLWWDLANGEANVAGVTTGPDGGSGVICAALPAKGGDCNRIGFYPDHQTWTKVTIPARHAEDSCGTKTNVGTQLWIGVDTEQPPTPDGLRRKKLVKGYDATLADGQTWHCPTIRRGVTSCRLPMTANVDDAGEWCRRISDNYVSAWGQSGGFQPLDDAIWDSSEAWCDDVMSEQERLDAAETCLGVNYRIGRHEIGLLELIEFGHFEETTEPQSSLAKIIDAALDFPFLESIAGDAEKKTIVSERLRALDDSRHGAEESIAAIARVVAS